MPVVRAKDVFWRFGLAGWLFSVFLPAMVLAATPTPEQIQQFQSLPPEQQAALAQQMGVDLGTLKAAGEQKQAPVETIEVVKPTAGETQQTPPNDAPVLTPGASNDAPAPTTSASKQIPSDDKLEYFGYDLFAGAPTTFAPVTEIPIPAEYVIGPGDTLRLQLYGKENREMELAVTREGNIQLPQIGPVSVAGLSFTELKSQIQQLVKEKYIGVEANLSLGALRSIRVFVLGEAKTPGAYTVSSLSTMTNALFVSGGVKQTGSLRRIQLKRQGEVVAEVDLYDLLLKGDTSADRRLLPGDVLFIPPVGDRASIRGQVQRPAIYELKGKSSLTELVNLAGGYTPEAYPKLTKITRIGANFSRDVRDVDAAGGGASLTLRNGDVVAIASINSLVDGYVRLAGTVVRPGVFQWRAGLHVSDLLPSISRDLKDSTELDYALVIREVNRRQDIRVIAFNLAGAINHPRSEDDPMLADRDQVLVFDRLASRDDLLNGVNDRLIRQIAPGQKPDIVNVEGAVRFPGRYPLTADLRVRDVLLTAGGALPEVVDYDYALLVREINPQRDIAVFQVDIDRVLNFPQAEGNQTLQGRDRLIVFNRFEGRQELVESINKRLASQVRPGEPPAVVSIAGAVRFPGQYPLAQGHTLTHLVKAAGGLLDSSFTAQAEISRVELGVDASRTEVYNVALAAAEAGQAADFLLQGRDRVTIKKIPDYAERLTVNLTGEVTFPGEYVVRKGETLSQLLTRAGGINDLAYPQGAVFAREQLKAQEQQRIKESQEKLRSDIAALQVQVQSDPNSKAKPEDLAQLQGLLSALDTNKAVGRLVLDLPALMAGDPTKDIILQDGDALKVPPRPQSVSVLGEVQFATSHLFDEGQNVNDYVAKSGGSTINADEGRIYVVKANGAVWLPNGQSWFGGEKLAPGDTIVVPVDTDRLNQLQLWTNVSQVFYQIALGAAAVASL